jgi:hypothetical protein
MTGGLAMRSLIVVMSLLAQSRAGTETEDRYKPASQAEIEAVLAEHERIDFTTEMNEAAEAKHVRLSARMYFAIKSVEVFRNTSQRKILRESERDLSNFVSVRANPSLTSGPEARTGGSRRKTHANTRRVAPSSGAFPA